MGAVKPKILFFKEKIGFLGRFGTLFRRVREKERLIFLAFFAKENAVDFSKYSQEKLGLA